MRSLKIVFFILLLAMVSFAGVHSQKVYDGLLVNEVDITPIGEKDYKIFQKSIGGVICTKQDFIKILRANEYSCYLSLDEFSASEIYESLPSQNSRSSGTTRRAGNMRCQPITSNDAIGMRHSCFID